MAKLRKISQTAWEHPFQDRKHEFHLWNSQKEVADFCRLEDGTKRLIRVSFEPRFDIDVIDYFQVTSGREISFPRDFQALIKPIILGNPTSFLTIQILDVEQPEMSPTIMNTEGTASIKTRLGQQKFRIDLIAYWETCALCGLDFTYILKASHIKPWRDSDDNERLDPFNGLLLSPNYDSLFDKGYISFDDHGRILLSEAARNQAELLGLEDGMCLRKIDNRHKKYLAKHREYFGFTGAR